ncbi:hypothetical protein BDK51DRAFT_43172 [Blyttiomyces helicus]|uniref:Uncharacterized protein n=1 Tax=Blyttiomyces helicus TaxID=388810 RepID=A0A4P9W1G4_9FUNG|nr:hypothetical protein BDK51DRAFT_43172 [Blyttiomyces helicus]|eukprot:RKO84993.1 hypothetical protein BDK51DRAFT_43172 [Blyttiomyces helicus]
MYLHAASRMSLVAMISSKRESVSAVIVRIAFLPVYFAGRSTPVGVRVMGRVELMGSERRPQQLLALRRAHSFVETELGRNALEGGTMAARGVGEGCLCEDKCECGIVRRHADVGEDQVRRERRESPSPTPSGAPIPSPIPGAQAPSPRSTVPTRKFREEKATCNSCGVEQMILVMQGPESSLANGPRATFTCDSCNVATRSPAKPPGEPKAKTIRQDLCIFHPLLIRLHRSGAKRRPAPRCE